MRGGEIDLVVVGSDRIAANGDVANKIGTYSVAVLARENGIPFYVAAPLSTIDFDCPDGSRIPIEERDAARGHRAVRHARRPRGREGAQPGLRRDPRRYVTAIVTEHGIARPPYTRLAARVAQARRREGRRRAMTRILGIETSCDETAAAVVEDRHRVLSSVVASQVELHRKYGGVVPEIAARHHVEAIDPVVRQALGDAGTTLDRIDAVAVTQGPGLIGSLLVGVCAAKAIAWQRELPLLAVNHLEGHVRSVFIEHPEIEFPAIALVVSGGHTSLYLCPEEGVYRSLARTRDDAAGEAFDKVAKLLGLGYPGGPIIERLARGADDRAYDFPDGADEGPLARFLVQRAEDRGAAPGPERRPDPHRGRRRRGSRKPCATWPPRSSGPWCEVLVRRTVAGLPARGRARRCCCRGAWPATAGYATSSSGPRAPRG